MSHVKMPMNGCSCDECCAVRARGRRRHDVEGAAADRERHVTERAQAIARAYQSAALNRGLPTRPVDETAEVMRDLIDVGMIR